jgi:2-keto-4-pentenoate hydratase/2-oxohepta-3-ene-1,7-dioic acid hydratase in catechol pathway
MRVANVGGRLQLVVGEGLLDVNTASGGRFSSDPQSAYDRWAQLRAWADGLDPAALAEVVPLRFEELAAPVPAPRQVFAIALNYKAHILEAGRPMPLVPGVFTKFATCLTGPAATVFLPAPTVDWEVELVVVMGRPAFRVPASRAWDYVAGLTAGQDLSERELQLGGTFPQLSLAKSMPGFGPLGPVVVSPDELADPADLQVESVLNGVSEQCSRTSDMVFDVPTLIEFISATCPMQPGDLIFTGTPGGIGGSRTPPVYLRDGDVLVTRIEGIGELRNTFTADPALASRYPAIS